MTLIERIGHCVGPIDARRAETLSSDGNLLSQAWCHFRFVGVLLLQAIGAFRNQGGGGGIGGLDRKSFVALGAVIVFRFFLAYLSGYLNAEHAPAKTAGLLERSPHVRGWAFPDIHLILLI
jgi:hypothetical protein